MKAYFGVQFSTKNEVMVLVKVTHQMPIRILKLIFSRLKLDDDELDWKILFKSGSLIKELRDLVNVIE